MPRHLLPVAPLLHPDCCEAKMRSLSSEGHLPCPCHGLAAGDHDRVVVDAHVLDLSVVRSECKHTRRDQS